MESVIVGLDPGTTTGIAILSLKGEIISLLSRKGLGLDQVVKAVYEQGKPLLIGCDKKKTPSLVRSFAAKTGAKLVSPKKDMAFEEKKHLVREKIKNTHEFDSLASARFARASWNEVIMRGIELANKEGLSQTLVLEGTIKKGLSPTEVISSLKKKSPIRVVKKRVHQKDDTQKLIQTIHQLRDDNMNLSKKVKELKDSLKDSRDVRLSKKGKNDKHNLRALENEITKRDDALSIVKNEYDSLLSFIDMAKDHSILRKVKDLRSELPKERILVVERPDIFSDKVVERAKGTLAFIISTIHSDKLPFFFIAKEGLVKEEITSFALVDEKVLAKRMEQKGMLDKIVNEYKASRG